MRRLLLIGPVLAVAALGATPELALGASVGVDTREGRIVYRAAPGERNEVRISAVARGQGVRVSITLRIADSVPIAPGSGCTRPNARMPRVALCSYRRGSLSRPMVRLGDRSDSATFRTSADLGVFLTGGPGDDELAGGRWTDVLAGGPGDDVRSGGAGSDTFDEGVAANGSDEMLGGNGPDGPLSGFDRVDYGARRHSIRADLGGDRDDGERGERDLIGADVEGIGGGQADDRLTGNASANQLAGRHGSDQILGGGGSDRLFADGGGTVRAVTSDSLDGGPGSDLLFGGPGPNLVTGGADADIIHPGDGRDTVHARDGAVDTVQCGRGHDLVRNDPFEFLLGCERSDPYSSASPVPLELSVPAGQSGVSLLVGCRERHPAPCVGTVQLELDGDAISAEVAFSGPNRHRYQFTFTTDPPLPPMSERRADFLVRIRAHDAAGAPTDDAFPVPSLLLGYPFL